MELNKRIKYKALYLLSQTPLRELLERYRHKDLKESDVFLVSYQNSGSTWLRDLIYESITGKKPWKPESKKEFPFINSKKNTKPIIKGKRRIIKSHSPYRKEYQGKKVIYLVRDPRDVAVSKYEKRKKNVGDVNKGNKEIKKFVKGKMVSEGRWDRHVKSWLNAKEQGKVDLYLVKYKDLKKNPEKELKGILEFLGVDFTKKDIEKAIKDNSIEKTKKHRFVRKGQAGNWEKELTKEQTKKIEESFRETMERVGYLK